MGHRRGESRQQATLFPVLLDDLVTQDALVRVIDAWVATLDMNGLRFGKAQPQVMGAPPYDPADLLKLYIWGYLGAVRSSRNLERDCRRNVECMWLLGRLTPDHKTIAVTIRVEAGVDYVFFLVIRWHLVPPRYQRTTPKRAPHRTTLWPRPSRSIAARRCVTAIL